MALLELAMQVPVQRAGIRVLTVSGPEHPEAFTVLDLEDEVIADLAGLAFALPPFAFDAFGAVGNRCCGEILSLSKSVAGAGLRAREYRSPPTPPGKAGRRHSGWPECPIDLRHRHAAAPRRRRRSGYRQQPRREPRPSPSFR